VKDTAESVHKSPFVEVAHKVLLAGVGAAALAQDEIEDFVNRLVERGEIAEADGKKMLKDITKKRKKVVDASAETTKKVSSDLEKRIEEAMSKMNIPTKDEIEALGAKITALTKKVDELKKSS
jgi:poly(hydroxyalkanoate) granule-associated protein